jgi:hypothetical protein
VFLHASRANVGDDTAVQRARIAESFSNDFFLWIEGQIMTRRALWIGIAVALLQANSANAQQYPMLDSVAGKIVQKYQQSSCEQLWQERAQKQGQPKPAGEQRAVEMMRNDPQMRAAFIDRVAAPIANKMFECGMIP